MNERRTSVEQQCESIKRWVMFGRQLAASNVSPFLLTASVSTFVSLWKTAYNTEIALKDKQCGVCTVGQIIDFLDTVGVPGQPPTTPTPQFFWCPGQEREVRHATAVTLQKGKLVRIEHQRLNSSSPDGSQLHWSEKRSVNFRIQEECPLIETVLLPQKSQCPIVHMISKTFSYITVVS
jgi:hypothetical protein